MSVFQLLGEISAHLLLTIMTNEPSVVSDDYMSLDGIRDASILLGDQAFSDRASAFAGRVIRTKPIYDPMNATNLV